jgi:Rrf2 family protein
MIDLGVARWQGRSRLGLRELAGHESLSPKFLEQILHRLRGAGYVEGRRGRGGGYALAQPPERIVVGDLLRLLDGPLGPIPCVSERAYVPCSCQDEAHCGLRILMLDVRAALSAVVDRHTLADLVSITVRALAQDRRPLPFPSQEAKR